LFGAASAVLGHVGAIALPAAFGYESTNTAGMMALMSGLLFFLAVVFGPRHGVLSRLRARISAT
jgi:manganese/zinc/iron transport system permease protein